jgi:hypothetical protein
VNLKFKKKEFRLIFNEMPSFSFLPVHEIRMAICPALQTYIPASLKKCLDEGVLLKERQALKIN